MLFGIQFILLACLVKYHFERHRRRRLYGNFAQVIDLHNHIRSHFLKNQDILLQHSHLIILKPFFISSFGTDAARRPRRLSCLSGRDIPVG